MGFRTMNLARQDPPLRGVRRATYIYTKVHANRSAQTCQLIRECNPRGSCFVIRNVTQRLVVFHGWFWFSLYVDVNKRFAVVLAYDLALFENRVMDAEIFLPQLPQDQRSGIDPYRDIAWSTGYGRVTWRPKNSDGSAMLLSRCRDRSNPSGSFLEFGSKDLCDLAESLFFTASRGWAIGLFGLRADALVGHRKDTLKLMFDSFGQFKGIGLIT